jgi:hypothetical protein
VAGLDVSRLRAVVAGVDSSRVEGLAREVLALGHDVVARETDLRLVASTAAQTGPDVALVWFGDLTSWPVDDLLAEAVCPVIALSALEVVSAYAASPGVFAWIVARSPAEMRSDLAGALQRLSAHDGRHGAFGARAAVELARGILMGRHVIDVDAASDMLAEHSRHYAGDLVATARAVLDGQALLVSKPAAWREITTASVDRRDSQATCAAAGRVPAR